MVCVRVCACGIWFGVWKQTNNQRIWQKYTNPIRLLRLAFRFGAFAPI